MNPSRNIVLSFGTLGVNDNTTGDLSAPYDAKEIGDFCGLTPPFTAAFAVEKALSLLDRD